MWKKSDTLDQQIKNVGYKPEDVKYVILSHAHLDHAGGMTYFPKAKFLAGKNEIRYAYWPEAEKRWAFILNDYIPTRGYDWLELDQDFDLFGDGSLKSRTASLKRWVRVAVSAGSLIRLPAG